MDILNIQLKTMSSKKKKKTNGRGNQKKKKYWKPLQQKELKLNSNFIRNDNNNHKVNENC